MGNACSSSNTKSDKDVRPIPNANRPQRRSRPAPAGLELAAAGGDDANANALSAHADDDIDDDMDEEEKENDGFEANQLTPAQVLRFLKLSAFSLASIAGAFYVTRKLALGTSGGGADNWDMAMSGVESQMLPSKFARGCVSCGLKSMKTVTSDNDQKNASKGAISGAESLHKAYAAGDDFAPPRVYHNFWASEPPSQYYSKSETIKNRRFTRIFGW